MGGRWSGLRRRDIRSSARGRWRNCELGFREVQSCSKCFAICLGQTPKVAIRFLPLWDSFCFYCVSVLRGVSQRLYPGAGSTKVTFCTLLVLVESTIAQNLDLVLDCSISQLMAPLIWGGCFWVSYREMSIPIDDHSKQIWVSYAYLSGVQSLMLLKVLCKCSTLSSLVKDPHHVPDFPLPHSHPAPSYPQPDHHSQPCSSTLL